MLYNKRLWHESNAPIEVQFCLIIQTIGLKYLLPFLLKLKLEFNFMVYKLISNVRQLCQCHYCPHAGAMFAHQISGSCCRHSPDPFRQDVTKCDRSKVGFVYMQIVNCLWWWLGLCVYIYQPCMLPCVLLLLLTRRRFKLSFFFV